MPSSNYPLVTSWPAATAWPTQTSWPSSFPSSVVPAIWYDGNQQAYSDLAGTVPVSSGLIRRLNEPPAQAGSWVTPSDPERPIRDSNSVRYEPLGASGGYAMTRVAVGGIVGNACTLLATVTMRDGANGCPNEPVIRSDDGNVGIWVGRTLWVYYNGGTLWFTALVLAQGAKNTITVRHTPTGLEAQVTANGVTTTEQLVAAIAGTAVSSAWRVGNSGVDRLYGSLAQALVVGRAVTDGERAAMTSWAQSQTTPDAYPDTRALITYVGDSITASVSCAYPDNYIFKALNSVRSTKPLTENCNTATPGYSTAGILLAGAGTTYYTAKLFYSATRIKNVLVVFLGTNDLASVNSVAFYLQGTAPPTIAGSGLYPLCDDARARGWKVVLIGPPPRSASLSVPQATFDAKRAAAYVDIDANWTAHADAYVDFRAIAGIGADADAFNAAMYPDGVHLSAAGHALLYPPVAAAVLPFL